MIFCIPTYIKLFKCKIYTTGKIVEVDDIADNYIRVTYVYFVSDNKYTNKTNWTANAIFRVDAECQVLYDESNPSCSYLKWSGEKIRCFIGTIFLIVGIGVLLIGVFLNNKL